MMENTSEYYSQPSTPKREDCCERSGPHKNWAKGKSNHMLAGRHANAHERAVDGMDRHEMPVDARRPADAPRDGQHQESIAV